MFEKRKGVIVFGSLVKESVIPLVKKLIGKIESSVSRNRAYASRPSNWRSSGGGCGGGGGGS